MENHLGRLLTSEEIVHHKDKNKLNNNLSNLVVVTELEHRQLHADDNPAAIITSVCPVCKDTFNGTKSNLEYKLKRGKQPCCSKGCANTLRTTLQGVGTTKDTETITRIKHLRKIGGTSYTIAKELGIARNTVMKYWTTAPIA